MIIYNINDKMKKNQIRTNVQSRGLKLSPLTLIRFSSSSDGSVESKSPSMTNCGTPRLRQ